MTTPFRRHLKWLAFVVFGIGGVLMGVVAGRLAANAEQQRASTLSTEHFAERSAAFAREMQEITEELHHVRSFFLASGHVTRKEFRVFATEILGRHSAIVAVEWAPRVPEGARPLHERLAREEGLSGYQIRVLGPDGAMVAAPAKADHYPVFFTEPLDKHRDVLGFDLSSERARLAALTRAAATGQPSATSPIDLGQDNGPGKGFLVAMSVDGGVGPGEARADAAPSGFVLLAVQVHDIFRQLFEQSGPGRTPGILFELADAGAGGTAAVLESSWGGSSGRFYRDWRYVERFEVGGRQWQLTGRPTAAYVSTHLTRNPVLLGVGLGLIWGLLGGFAIVLVRRARDLAFRKQTRIIETSLHSLAEGVIVADASGRFILFNDTAEKVLGMGRRDVDVPEWSATYGCFYEDGQTPFPSEQLPLARALRGEASTADVFIRNHNLPQGVYISITGTPIRDEDGAADGGVVVFRDVTAAKLTEQQVRASVKQLEDLRYAVDQAALVAMTDSHGTITYVNDKFCEVSGYSKTDLVGRNHRILNSGFHPPAFFREMWLTITGGGVWRGRIRNRARDGRHFWVDTTIVPLVTDGKPERYLALRTDVTEQMRQQAELTRLSNAVEQTADAIMITDRDGIIEYVNPAFEAVTGYPRDEAVGQTPRILRSGKQPPAYYEDLWRTLSAGRVFRGAPINRKKNGDLCHAEQTITPIKDSEGRIVHFVSVLKDVTDRIRAEQREMEMRYASDVQRRLYPAVAPAVPGLEFAAATFPALATCGDYYDYLPLANGSFGVVIGDVSGHGLGPALIMAETRAYLRFLSASCPSPGEVLTKINEVLYQDLDENRYVALILAHFDSSSRRLRYVNAGHTAAYHLDGAGAVKAVMESCGPPLGVLPGVAFPAVENPPLEEGDVVVFLTDGITEAENPSGDYFGTDAALDVVRAHLRETAQDIVQRLRQATSDFAKGAPQQDDITVLVCKVGPPRPAA
jgi:PAS domain S-box-containing protein